MLRGPSYLSDFNQIWIRLADFIKTSCYRIQRRQTDSHAEANNLSSQLCERAVFWKLILLPASSNRMKTSLLSSPD